MCCLCSSPFHHCYKFTAVNKWAVKLHSPLHPHRSVPCTQEGQSLELSALAKMPHSRFCARLGCCVPWSVPWRLSPMEISVVQGRAEELMLPQALWQGPAISIRIMETVAQPPSTHSGIFLGLAVLMRER